MSLCWLLIIKKQKPENGKRKSPKIVRLSKQ
jgi:hypothetical protein